jgi:gliding motility-associated-like protein
MLNAKYPMILPNIITPNNDDVNDTWDFSIHAINDIEFTVFNRWGNIVYTTNDGKQKWDGKNKSGSDLSEGIYYWQINFVSDCKPDERIKQNGYIQISR